MTSRAGSGYKYTRTEGSKICNIYILQIEAVHVKMDNHKQL